MYDIINPAKGTTELQQSPETFGFKLNMKQNMAYGASAATQIPLTESTHHKSMHNLLCKLLFHIFTLVYIGMIISPKYILATAVISLLSISSSANGKSISYLTSILKFQHWLIIEFDLSKQFTDSWVYI